MFSFIWAGSFRCVIALLAICSLTGCTESRQVGQIELFGVRETTHQLYRFGTPGETPQTVTDRHGPVAGSTDPVRLSKDVVTLRVDSVYLEKLPFTLTGSQDVVIFTEVWENAAEQQAVPLTAIVYTARNQQIPGLLNFTGGLGYGATHFKGHPMKVKFTVMVLQKRKSEEQKTAVDVIENISATAAPQYGMIVSGAAKLIKDVLSAQPDVASFDYEVTFASDQPEALLPRLKTGPAPEATQTDPPSDLGKTLYERRPWLRYGTYALIETGARTAQGGTTTVTETVAEAKEVVYSGGRLHRNPATTSAEVVGPLRTNYLVFSITPEQLAQDNQLLEEAGRRSLETLNQLRRSDADVAAAIQHAIDDTAFLIKGALRTKITQLADRAARQAKAAKKAKPAVVEKDKFGELFKASFDNFKAGVRDAEKPTAQEIYDELLASYNADYDSAAAAPPADGAPVGNNPAPATVPVERVPGRPAVSPGTPGGGPTPAPRNN